MRQFRSRDLSKLNTFLQASKINLKNYRSLSEFAVKYNENIRNVGIIAHIDAGKTTTTERFLFYAGKTKSVGEVDAGETVMDFLPVERERGITINSACTTIGWNDKVINIIDTPGHVDFTIEVERCMLALDSAVLLLDGIKGVEPQTKTVFEQARKRRIPCIGFVNKLDRPGSSYVEAIKSLSKEFNLLDVYPLKLQKPIFASDLNDIGMPEEIINHMNSGPSLSLTEDERLVGTMDLTSGEVTLFSTKTSYMDNVLKIPFETFNNCSDKSLMERFQIEQRELVDELGFLDAIFESLSDLEKLEPIQIRECVKRLVANSRDEGEFCVVPVFCGASYRNIGVQPLLDAITTFLPASPSIENKTDVTGFLGQVFKIQHDKNKGFLCYTRVHSGVLAKPNLINVSRKEEKEHFGETLVAFANDLEKVSEDSVTPGSIIILAGLKNAQTGDFLITNPKFAPLARKIIKEFPTFNIPTAVFSAGVSVPSLQTEDLDLALNIMTRDDPSLSFKFDEEMNQIILSGMGELHLSIAERHLKENFKIDAKLDDIRIAYRETLESPIEFTTTIANNLLAKKGTEEEEGEEEESLETITKETGNGITLSLRFEPCNNEDRLEIEINKRDAEDLSYETREMLIAIVQKALNKGPISSSPIIRAKCVIDLRKSKWNKSTKLSQLSTAFTYYFKRLYRDTSQMKHFCLLEPYGILKIESPDTYSSQIIKHITGNLRGEVLDVVADYENRKITARVTMKSVLKYATTLRTLSKAEATFSVQYEKYSISHEDFTK